MSDWDAEERVEFILQHASESPKLLRMTLVKIVNDHHTLIEENERLRERIRELEQGQQEDAPIALPGPPSKA